MTTVAILVLTHSINFRDADEGDSFAGDGKRILSVHSDRTVADLIAAEFNPILAQAEKETTIFPIQKFSAIFKNRFGFTPDDVQDGYNFKLVVEIFNVE